MSELLATATEQFLRAAAPESDEVAREMEAYGETHGPSTVGPDVGRLLRLVTRMSGAETVFEFGSGYGYSAYWFASGLPADGQVVLTDMDADNLELAREFLERGGLDGQAAFEVGDALEAVKRYDGPLDIVLIDFSKELYPAAFDAVREKVPPGGLVIADNAMVSTSLQFDKLVELLDGESPDGVNEATTGMAEYLRRVIGDPAFETSIVPLGEGVALSYRVE